MSGVFLGMAMRDHHEFTRVATHSAMKLSREVDQIIVIDDGSETPHEGDGSYRVVREDKSMGCTHSWNRIYREFLDSSTSEYLCISNNDVIFTMDWDRALVGAFEREDCGISGPITNAPGHQPLQMSPGSNDGPVKFLQSPAKLAPSLVSVPYVNGFCFMLKRDRLVAFDGENLFDPENIAYGNEDEYQKRMRGKGLRAYVAHGSRVWHFKDISMRTLRVAGKNPKLPKTIAKEDPNAE